MEIHLHRSDTTRKRVSDLPICPNPINPQLASRRKVVEKARVLWEKRELRRSALKTVILRSGRETAEGDMLATIDSRNRRKNIWREDGR